MLTLRDFHRLRRQQLLDFFSWRFGTPKYVSALCYTTGLSPATIENFRSGRSVGVGTLLTMENAALQLGFRPARTFDGSGAFTPPKSLRLPRWSDPACRIRFYQWQRETRWGERKPKWDKVSHIDAPKTDLDASSSDPCRTEVYNNQAPQAT